MLIGPMGAGKTTIGRLLAKKLGYQFVDSDKVIEERTGASIPLIFELEGEEGFRKREQAVIRELCDRDRHVIATGGGAVLREENRKVLKESGAVIYLYAELEQLIERTSRDKNRPLLQTENPRKKLEEIVRIRDPLYREIADIVFLTNKLNVGDAVDGVYQQLLPFIKTE